MLKGYDEYVDEICQYIHRVYFIRSNIAKCMGVIYVPADSSQYKSEGVVHIMAETRLPEDENHRRMKWEYRKFCEQTKNIEEISRFSFEAFDYQPELERKIFEVPPTPDYSHLVTEATVAARTSFLRGMTTRLGAVGLAVLFGIIVDVLLMDRLTGVVSLLCLSGAGVYTYWLKTLMSRRIATAAAKARQNVKVSIAAFQEQVEHDREVFIKEEEARIGFIQDLIAGAPYAVLAMAEQALAVISLPYVFHGGLTLGGNNLYLDSLIPHINFVPENEWRREHPHDYIVTERAPSTVVKIYAEAVAAGMVRMIIRLLERLPTIESVTANAYRRDVDREDCMMAVAVRREDIGEVIDKRSGLAVVGNYGVIRAGIGNVMEPIEPITPEWLSETSTDLRQVNFATYAGQA
ncbi:MAG: hypothetical protein P4N59_11975 [Negativicutes bacterium]|nr:hypothetical protein [Negativicutes bacterium]